MSHEVRFLLDGALQTVADIDPTLSVLDWLRRSKGRTGSKEGCAEGDCGACTVLVGEADGPDRVRWRAVNACILFLPMLDGCALLTVESLAQGDLLHPAQRALVEGHGSQCGFCTPGFVMSLYGRGVGATGTIGLPAADLLAGNLCRCTGYGPILAAAEAITPQPRRDDPATARALAPLQRSAPLSLVYHDPLGERIRRWLAPTSLDDLAQLLLAHPDATIVAGATDVGLWVTKQLRVLDTVIALGQVAALRQVVVSEAGVTLFGAVRYTEAQAALARLHPDLGELVRRIGALQVRNSGTIGGNIANGSPIGDMPPALIALGAELTLRRGSERRQLALEDFFLAYGRQDRQPGEFVESLFVPTPKAGSLIRIHKLSKRFDSDISALCGAFVLELDAGIIRRARVAFGGMAGTPRRAAHCEAALEGAPWSAATLERAAAALALDYTPLSDVRGRADYRLRAAGNLLRRWWHESQGQGGSVQTMAAIDA
jgi:xanthine dehydrogenase small subunit